MDKKQAPEAAVRFALFLKKYKPGVKRIYLFDSSQYMVARGVKCIAPLNKIIAGLKKSIQQQKAQKYHPLTPDP